MVANEGKTGAFIAKIGDLGSAKRMKQIKKNKLNNYGPCWRGTPMYLSPEVVVNGVQEKPADVWAVGCIVYEMLTGKPLRYSYHQDLGVNEMISRIGDGRDLFSVSSSLSAEGRSFLEECLCRKVMCRLTANMLLKHPFVKGLPDDDIDEIFDKNTITSSSLFSDDDDDELWLSSCSEDEDMDVTVNARFHEVRRFPVRL
ncbi:putative mitogen-activated protein kinase kinase kinase STE-STE11 family [Helianthus debilis subsp. tardiflorus]